MKSKLSILCLSFFVVMLFCVSLVQAQSNVAAGKSYVLSPNSGDYWADVSSKLTDGVSVVSSSSDTSKFVGWGVNIPTITVDLGSVLSVDSAELFVVDRGDVSGDSVLPNYVAFSYSSDGVNYSLLASISSSNFVSGRSRKYSSLFTPVNARYFRFYVNKNSTSTQIVSVSEIMVYDVVVPVPSELAFVQQPSDIVSGSPITPPVTVQLKDSQGSNVSESGVSVELSLTSGSGVLSGTLQQNTDSTGLATFSDISIDSAGSKVLTASSSGLTSAVSNAFNVSTVPTPTPPVPTPTPSVVSTPSMSGVIYGRVLNKSLSSFAGVKVEYSSVDNDYTGKNPVVTDVDGYYFFVNCDTSYASVLEMSLKGYGTVSVNVNGTSTGVVNRLPDVVMNKGNSGKFKLSGTVKDAYGTPVDFVRVTAKAGGSAYVDFTDLYGGYSFSDMLTGSYTVTIKRDGYYSGRFKYSNSDAFDGVLDMVILDRSYDYYAK